MGNATAYLNITARKAESIKLTEDDYDAFESFLGSKVQNHCVPSMFRLHLDNDHEEMWMLCEWYGVFDREVMKEFAGEHPDLQIEVIENYLDDDIRNRVLYQGELMEVLEEIRYFPSPKLINWEHLE